MTSDLPYKYFKKYKESSLLHGIDTLFQLDDREWARTKLLPYILDLCFDPHLSPLDSSLVYDIILITDPNIKLRDARRLYFPFVQLLADAQSMNIKQSIAYESLKIEEGKLYPEEGIFEDPPMIKDPEILRTC